MKWFKHYVDNHRGRSIQDLMDQLGHTGLCYYLLVEMCAEKLEKGDEGLTIADCLFSFHTRVVRQMLRISPANLRHLLGVCAANGLLSFEFSGSSLQIKMPILLNLLERNTKKAQRTRIDNAQKTHLDIDIEEDKDKDKDNRHVTRDDVTSSIKSVSEISKSDLEEVYQGYPRKQGKSEGLRRLKAQIKTKDDLASLGVAIQNYRDHLAKSGTEAKYVKQFSSFVTDWKDWLDPNNGMSEKIKQNNDDFYDEVFKKRDERDRRRVQNPV